MEKKSTGRLFRFCRAALSSAVETALHKEGQADGVETLAHKVERENRTKRRNKTDRRNKG